MSNRMHAHSTKADVRERLLALLYAHGVGGDAVKSRALNRAADAISDALDEAFRAGELHHDQGMRIS